MKINTKKFDNDLDLVSIYDKDSQSVSIMVLVRVGSRFEASEESGLAHFVEHNFFKGTKRRPSSKALGMAMEKIGGTSNAFTSYEYTGYYIKVPKENFDTALDIISDIINNSIFPRKEVERERGVIIEEIKMYDDMPMHKVAQNFMSDLFGTDHPLGIDIAGSIKSVSKLSVDHIKKFTEKYYTGENMLVSVAGGISNEEAISKIQDHFGDLSKGEKVKFKRVKNPKIDNKVNIYQKESEQTHIIIGGFGKPRDHEDRFAINTGITILGRGFGSKLFQKIREDLGLAYYVSASHSGFHEIGKWSVRLGVDNKRYLEALEGVIKELRNFMRGEFSDEEILRAKNYMIGKLVTELETSDDNAQWYGIQKLLNREVLSVEEVKKRIESITKDDIIETWSDILKNNNLIYTSISPDQKEEKIMDLVEAPF